MPLSITQTALIAIAVVFSLRIAVALSKEAESVSKERRTGRPKKEKKKLQSGANRSPKVIEKVSADDIVNEKVPSDQQTTILKDEIIDGAVEKSLPQHQSAEPLRRIPRVILVLRQKTEEENPYREWSKRPFSEYIDVISCSNGSAARVFIHDQAFWQGENDLGMPDPLELSGVAYFLIHLEGEPYVHPSPSTMLRSHRYKDQSIGMWARGTKAERRAIRQNYYMLRGDRSIGGNEVDCRYRKLYGGE